MKLFISYARVDKPLCKQIVHKLEDIHEVWYDKSIHAGQDWWNEIQERLAWCEGFVYLLSPESVASEYCQKEHAIAVEAGKHIFPVLIQARTKIPDSMRHIHYANLSEGMEDITTLLNALTYTERRQRKTAPPKPKPVVTKPEQPPQQDVSPTQALPQAADALEAQNFDSAVFIIKGALDKKPTGRVARMLQGLLSEAETALGRQAYLREAEREYAPIRELVRREVTRELGCAEFAEFRQDFPDYDPDDVFTVCRQADTQKRVPTVGTPFSASSPDISASAPNIPASAPDISASSPDISASGPDIPASGPDIPASSPNIPASGPDIPASGPDTQKPVPTRHFVASPFSAFAPDIPAQPDILPPPFAWIDIPAGKVTIEKQTFDVPAFAIAKYPTTNAQFAKFVEAGGYRERKWWTNAVWKQREKDGWTEPRHWNEGKWNGAEQPVVGVSWYEAIAYCQWLSEKTGQKILLPTEQQWQWAAQGDDGREYPWGDDFDSDRCNTSESRILQTTPVTRYQGKGDSPFGVTDMAGNVWEWCLTEYDRGHNNTAGTARRVLRGGSWYLDHGVARGAYRSDDFPLLRNINLGFRLVCVRAPSL